MRDFLREFRPGSQVVSPHSSLATRKAKLMPHKVEFVNENGVRIGIRVEDNSKNNPSFPVHVVIQAPLGMTVLDMTRQEATQLYQALQLHLEPRSYG